MTIPSLTQIIAIAAYLTAAGLLWQRMLRLKDEPGLPVQRGLLTAAIAVGLLSHGIALSTGLVSSGGLLLGLTTAGSLVAAVIITLFLLAMYIKPVECLGTILLPIAALAVLLHLIWPASGAYHTTPLAMTHIAISILSYGLIAIAAIQSLFLIFQERRLHRHNPGGLLRALPSLQTQETLMFQLIGVGFTLLTLTLFSGLFFSEQVFGVPFRFNHHIVLASAGWCVFAALLVGRWRKGWRGRIAAAWTLSGFGLLMLAYFGTKFVSEVVLHRAA